MFNMFRALDNTWRYKFYMGMQNDMNLEMTGFLFTPLNQSFPICLYLEAIHSCPRTREKRNIRHARANNVDDLYPIRSKQHRRVYACMALLCTWLHLSLIFRPDKAMNLVLQ